MKKQNGVLLKVNSLDLLLLKNNPAKFWNGIQEIGPNAFFSLKNLTEITIPDSVSKINSNAFLNCENLEKVYLPKVLKKIGLLSFGNCKKLKEVKGLEYVQEIDSFAFENCETLSNFNFSPNLEKISYSAFTNCKNLRFSTFPENIKTIQDFAFKNCHNMKKLYFSKNIENLGVEAFYNSKNLAEIVFEEDCNIKAFQNGLFANCYKLEKANIPNKVEKINQFAFANCYLLEEIKFPPSVTTISSYAFINCLGLKKITIPFETKTIGKNTFANCHPNAVFMIEFEKGKWARVPEKIMNKIEFDKLKTFLKQKELAGKRLFFPDPLIVEILPTEFIKGFYQNKNYWKEICSNCPRPINSAIKNEYKTNLFKLCLVMGLFSENGKTSKKAFDFINEKILPCFTPKEFNEKFSNLNTEKNGFIPKFAEFVIENYKNSSFLTQVEDCEFDNATKKIDYFSKIYNSFKLVEEFYPHKKVHTNTNYDRLGEKIVLDFAKTKPYENIIDSDIAKLASYYGYSQQDFETIQSWYIEGKQKKCNINCLKDNKTDGITFEFLNKDSKIAPFLGNITNCCQVLKKQGSTCVKDGLTNPNSGFMVYKKNNKIVGQSWVWYNEKLGKVCLDFIAVPKNIREEYCKKDDLLKCVVRSANALIKGMEEKGKKVVVTTSKGMSYVNRVSETAKDFPFVQITPKSKILASFGIACESLTGGAPCGTMTDTARGEYLFVPNK